jgi:cysteine protease ATG4
MASVADSQTIILYVAGFDAVGQANLTSDVGWGCMLRSGQMLLAQVCLVAGIFEL